MFKSQMLAIPKHDISGRQWRNRTGRLLIKCILIKAASNSRLLDNVLQSTVMTGEMKIKD